MSAFHAICPSCGKSLYLESNREDVYVCPFCGKNITFSELMTSGNLIDVDRAKTEYGRAHEFFEQGDFKAAEKCFDKVREIDKNNFFAEYFYRLCNIRFLRQSGKLCGAEFIVGLIEAPLAKMGYTDQPEQIKRGFLLHVFAEAESLINALYETVSNLFSKADDVATGRKEFLAMARDCRRLTLLDRRTAMLDDKEVCSHLIMLCNTVMNGLQNVVAYKYTDNRMFVPDESQYDEARALFGVYYHFVRSLDAEYKLPRPEQIFKENSDYNKLTVNVIDKYRSECTDRALHICQSGARLTDMLYHCRSAFDYTYNTVFNSLGVRSGASAGDELLPDAIFFAHELVKPRVYKAADGQLVFDAADTKTLRDLCRKLNVVCAELERTDRNRLNIALEEMYADIFEISRYHYTEVVQSVRREFPDIRIQKNKQYFFYRNFLYGIVCSGVIALTQSVSYDKHRTGDRVKLLRLSKQAAEDLLYLFNYKTEEIENAPKFNDFTRIYGFINTDIKAMS